MVRVGVLALQGSFREHTTVLQRCGAEAIEVRTKEELHSCAGLIIPGGESTTMAHIAVKTGMLDELRKFVIEESKPVWGTCAGLIFLAETAEGASYTRVPCGAGLLAAGPHMQWYRSPATCTLCPENTCLWMNTPQRAVPSTLRCAHAVGHGSLPIPLWSKPCCAAQCLVLLPASKLAIQKGRWKHQSTRVRPGSR